MDEDAILRLLRRQAGVVSRAQVRELGGTDDDIERLVRRRLWATVHRGVYVDHTGPLTWDQRAWAAVLYHAPAVLDGRSAMRAHRMRVVPAIAPDSEPIEVAVAQGRRVAPAAGIRVRRVRDLETVSRTTGRPPRLDLEHAVLRAAAAASREDTSVAILADACQDGRTTARRLAAALGRHPRVRNRRLLAEVLDDVSSGACSALERRYLVQVERAHGLPPGVPSGAGGRSDLPRRALRPREGGRRARRSAGPRPHRAALGRPRPRSLGGRIRRGDGARGLGPGARALPARGCRRSAAEEPRLGRSATRLRTRVPRRRQWRSSGTRCRRISIVAVVGRRRPS